MKYDCLIVDDEKALSESTCEYFNMFSVKNAWVADSKSCIDFFRVPVMFISARISDDDMLTALSIGGVAYIQKPYSLSVL